MMGVYFSIGIYWGSTRSVLASDAFAQFSNFHASFNNMLHGKQSIFYTWNASLGLNYYALLAYYLGGIFTPIVFFFKNSNIPDALYLLTLLKIGFASVAFWVYAKNTFKISRWLHVAFAIAYSLMSFATAQSELIMWLDTFVYLPLIILGINRLMEKNKPICLFVSYLFLFISNFYMAFMVGIFSVLYYFAKVFANWKTYKRTLLPYFITSLLAGCTSLIVILPTVLDLRTNGETFTEITTFKTEATAFWDIVIKNMVGVFDTTKYGSIPFIYIGLLPLIFCLYFFVTNKIPLKTKISFGAIFAIIIASFYIVPLNLFWHGMHAPNMFLFRYSFTFSFLVIMLAGYGLEKYTREDEGLIVGTIIMLMAIFILARGFMKQGSYTYVTDNSFYFTLFFLFLYLASIVLYQMQRVPIKRLAILLLLLVSVEATLNTNAMINGILKDWNYASRSLYSEPQKTYQAAVSAIHKDEKKTFYRTETLDPISANDSINYGFSGISMFSSIRNRNSSSMMNTLGFRSRGTGLNIRYQNNTLLMDSLFGIKYNVAKQDPLKYGFSQLYSNSTYTVYKNENALPLGMLTDKNIYSTKLPETDNLGSQTNLFNQLADSNQNYFTFTKPTIVDSTNTTITNKDQNTLSLTEQSENIAKTVTWEVLVPAGKQAYFSLFPTNFDQLESSTATVTVNGVSAKTQINISGQYYNIGNYTKETLVRFSVIFYGTKTVSFVDPPVILLDTQNYMDSLNKIKKKAVNFSVSGRKASATVNAKKDQVLFTTIPYDKGWTAYVDGKKVTIKSWKNSFVTIPISKGKHTIQLTFLPYGFKTGVICFVLGISLFILYVKKGSQWRTSQKKKRERKKINS